jgi:hypothetical protein
MTSLFARPRLGWLAALSLLLGLGATPAPAAPDALELSLLIDVSGSVDANEFALQRTGYVNAFNSATIQNAIAGLAGQGGIAVNLIYWSSGNEQQQAVGWTQITNALQAQQFAAAIAAAGRPFSGLTAPGSAINFAAPLFEGNGFEGARQVIDVSGDGEQNDGANTATARNNFLAGAPPGVSRAINGLAIQTSDFPNLAVWYAANIQGGTNSFTIATDGFEDFAAAVATKLQIEITGGVVPVPPALALAGTGVVSLLGFRLRRRNVAAA